MVIGLSGVQFGLQSYEWLTKSDDHEAGVRFVNHEYDSDQTGRHDVMLPINQNYDKILETNKPLIEHWKILKRRF